MMYYPYFITYMIIGLAISLVVFLWALKSGQFRDQRRARFLPFHDGLGTSETKPSPWNRLEIYGLLFLAVSGLAASLAVVVFALKA